MMFKQFIYRFETDRVAVRKRTKTNRGDKSNVGIKIDVIKVEEGIKACRVNRSFRGWGEGRGTLFLLDGFLPRGPL